MQYKCVQAAQRLADRAKSLGKTGTTISPREMAELEADLGLVLPPWLRQIFTEVPLCGLELGKQVEPTDEEDDGIMAVEWATADDIRSESLNAYPGLTIRSLGYVDVAGRDGSGDPIFVCIHDGDDPPVYRIYHEVSDVGEEIIAGGREVEAPSLSEFFDSAVIKRG